MGRWILLVGPSAVAALAAACAAPPPTPLTCEEGTPGCTQPFQEDRPSRSSSHAGPVGLPEEALPEDQETPPPNVTRPKSATAPPDAGGTIDASTSLGNEIPDASAPPDPPPIIDPEPPPPPPTGSCWSGTLGMFLEPLGCYQRKQDGMWFQCKDTLWYRNVVDGVGPFGPCTSVHPLAH